MQAGVECSSMTGFEPLFGVILKVGDYIGSWAVQQILDVLVTCPKCGQKDLSRIGNRIFNQIECRNCHLGANQFTNACAQTVDTASGEIGHASFRLDHTVKRVRTGILGFGKITHFALPYGVRSRGVPGRSLAIEVTLIDFSSGWQVSNPRIIVLNSGHQDRGYHRWKSPSLKVYSSSYPFWAEGKLHHTTVLRCRSRLLTEDRHILHSYDRVVDVQPGDVHPHNLHHVFHASSPPGEFHIGIHHPLTDPMK
jgi:hypothetical protein